MRLQNIRWTRTLRKGAAQLALAVVLLIVGYLIENSADLGLSATAVVVLDTIRRLIRDARAAEPAP